MFFVFQKVSEKVGGAEGTKLDDDFREMEKVLLEFTKQMSLNVKFSFLQKKKWKRVQHRRLAVRVRTQTLGSEPGCLFS